MNNTTAMIIPNNKGKLIGRLTGEVINRFEVEGEWFCESKIEVARLSDATDVLPFTISEKLVKAYSLNLEEQSEIEFIGELRSYNRVIEGKSKLILSFFVKEVQTELDEDCSNELTLTGYICKDPVFRTTPFNRQICDILLAVNRTAFNKSDYIPCILWGRNAKFIQTQKVGTKITLTGRIQSRTYKKEIAEGEVIERTAYEVSCQKVCVEEKIEGSQQYGA